MKQSDRFCSHCVPAFWLWREVLDAEAGFCALVKSTCWKGWGQSFTGVPLRRISGSHSHLYPCLTYTEWVVSKVKFSVMCGTEAKEQQIGPLAVHRQVLMSQVTHCFGFILIWANILKTKRFPTKLELCHLLKLKTWCRWALISVRQYSAVSE